MIKGITNIKDLENINLSGKNRQYILDKAVRSVITSKNRRLGTQGDRHHFLLDKVGRTDN